MYRKKKKCTSGNVMNCTTKEMEVEHMIKAALYTCYTLVILLNMKHHETTVVLIDINEVSYLTLTCLPDSLATL